MRPYYPFMIRMEAVKGAFAGQSCRIIVNADGSIFVDDWDFVIAWYEQDIGYRSPEFVLLTLLLAARGHIKESTSEEVRAIAMGTIADEQQQSDLPNPADTIH